MTAAAGLILSAAGKPPSKKWNLGLALQVLGRYQVIGRSVTYNGDFALTLTWEGVMEEDDDDFRLVRREVSLPRWEAQEISSAISEDSPLTTADFPDKPSFRTFFVLREGPNIQIVFGLEDLEIPVHSAGEKVALEMPRTAGGDIPLSDIDYKAHIKKGSNLLWFPSELIARRSVERTLTWAWRRQSWPQTSGQILSVLSNHQVTAKVIIRPQADPP